MVGYYLIKMVIYFTENYFNIVIIVMSKLADEITLDSKDRLSTSASSTNFTMQITSPAITALSKYKLTHVFFPATYDNVTATTNACTVDGNAVSIAAGYYGIDDIIIALNAAAPANFTFSYAGNNRVVITSDLAAAFIFLEGTIRDVLGFDDAAYAGATSYTAPFFPNLALNKDHFTLHSRALTRERRTPYIHSDYRSNMIASIPNKQEHGTVVSYEPQEPHVMFVREHAIETIDFQLRDSANVILNLNGRSVITIWRRYGD